MVERSVFKVFLMIVIVVSMEIELYDGKDDFVVNICCYFVMIFYVELVVNNFGGSFGLFSIVVSFGVFNVRICSNWV